MLKLLGSILIIGASAALGLAMRQQAVIRIRVLSEWIDCMNLLILEVNGHGATLHETFLIISKSRNSLAAPFFSDMAKQISGMPSYDFKVLWKKTIREHAEKWGIKSDELNILNSVSDYLGQYDGTAQTNSMRTAMLRLQEIRDIASDELRSNNSIYRTCGAAAGILLVLVLI